MCAEARYLRPVNGELKRRTRLVSNAQCWAEGNRSPRSGVSDPASLPEAAAAQQRDDERSAPFSPTLRRSDGRVETVETGGSDAWKPHRK